MSRTPRFHSSSGLTGLGLVLLAAALLAGVGYFFLLGAPAQGRGAQAAERGASRSATPQQESPAEDLRGAAPVELVPAGTNLLPAAPAALATEASAAEPTPLALDTPAVDPLALTAAPADGKSDGPELKYVREGKGELVKGKDLRRERRSDRRERAAEAEALGLPNEKRALESPKKNATRSQVKKVGAQEEKPTRRPKTPPPGNAPGETGNGG